MHHPQYIYIIPIIAVYILIIIIAILAINYFFRNYKVVKK